jgi:hypothetical protein
LVEVGVDVGVGEGVRVGVGVALGEGAAVWVWLAVGTDAISGLDVEVGGRSTPNAAEAPSELRRVGMPVLQ